MLYNADRVISSRIPVEELAEKKKEKAKKIKAKEEEGA